MHKYYKSPQLKPILYYGAFIAIFYLLVFVLRFPIEVFGLLLPIVMYVVAPLTAVFYIVKSVHSDKEKFNWKVLFGYCAVPGLMSGLLFAYGLYTMVHGEPSLFASIPFAVATVVFGLISGVFGLALRHFQ